MKEAVKKYGALLLVLIVVSGVCLLFSVRKSGMFIDEIYTYGLSNSHYAPFVKDVQGGTLVDTVMTRQDLLDYVTVNDGEGLDFGSVYYNQVNDVHPPLYYWIFNAVSSLTPNVFSKWTGLILDYVIYLAAILLLYRLVLRLYGSRDNAAAAAALYGLSVLGLSTMLMIRMYVLMTMLTILLALLVARLLEERRAIWYPLIGLTIFLGLMTQYYFVFYAFFLCAAVVFWLLAKREYKALALFALWAFLGVGCLVLVFPACLDHLFAEKLVSGGNALDNLRDLSQYKPRLVFFYKELRHGTRAAIVIALAAILGLLLCGKKLAAAMKAGQIRWTSLVILIPVLPTLILVALISPVLEQRYIYNLVPVFILCVSFLLYLLEQSLGDFPHAFWWKQAAVLLILAAALWEARTVPPQYLYPEYRDYDALTAAHGNDPCLYMTDDFSWPITQDLQQLLAFEDFFITGDPDSPALDAYLAQKGESAECVVYIDVSEFWSSGFKPEEMLPRLVASTGYTGYEVLYENGLSVTYLLTK